MDDPDTVGLIVYLLWYPDLQPQWIHRGSAHAYDRGSLTPPLFLLLENLSCLGTAMKSDTTLSEELIDQARTLSTASLHEAAGRRGALPAVLKPLATTMRVCGPALPVRCPPGDNLFIHRAIAAAQPGDVLVVNTCGGVEYGYWGEIMASAAIARRLSGLIITGGVRDHLRLVELAWPTFCACICIRGTAKNPESDGAVGEAVTIGDITVRCGDLILGTPTVSCLLRQQSPPGRYPLPGSETRRRSASWRKLPPARPPWKSTICLPE